MQFNLTLALPFDENKSVPLKRIFSLQKIKQSKSNTILPASVAALGVVYGDIGTSPLYALRASLSGLPIDKINVLGVLSLISWSLFLVISIKYLIILLRADNNGEGGILALLSLIKRKGVGKAHLLFLVSIFGAGLVLGDGMITPAISILGAIEGVNIFEPLLSPWVLPSTCIILFFLFSMQSFGTEKIGFIFGPVILIWFCTLAVLGYVQISHNPVVMEAMSPYYAVDFFYRNGWTGYALLGGVFLVVTGGEALYADLGHFGRAPIRLAWFALVLPCLLLNYYGQGAYLLDHPEAISNPFYMLAPKWFLIPLIIIATLATIIASQAVISATFSMTKQAVLLGLYPRLPIVQTSSLQQGQIYIPQMNRLLAIGTLFLILTFKSSTALTHAYGLAVNLVMFLTSILLIQLAINTWHWGRISTFCMLSFFVAIDIAFLGANIPKLDSGGWVPLAFAGVSALIMYTWHDGRLYLHKTYYMKKEKLAKLFKQLDYKSVNHLPDMTAIFITDIYDNSGGNFLQFLKMNRILPEHILIINYAIHNIPYVISTDRFQLKCLKSNIYQLTLQYGFMDIISITQSLYVANERGILPFSINIETATYFIEVSNVVASREHTTMKFFWQKKLFTYLVRNDSTDLNIEFYQLPYDRTVGIGAYYMI